MYNLPSGRDVRATSLGYGNKVETVNKSMFDTPSPFAYFLNSSVQEKPSKSKGISFGLSRKECTF